MIERRRPTPLELTIDESLSKNQVVRLELHAKELEEVIAMMTQHLLQESGVSEAETPTVNVTMAEALAVVEIEARIKKPVKATFKIAYILQNALGNPGKLQPGNIQIQTSAGLLAKAAIKIQMVDEKITYALNNINDTIIKNPPPIMQEHGHTFSDISLTLENGTLAVQLRSD